jgi:hypothetical protein
MPPERAFPYLVNTTPRSPRFSHCPCRPATAKTFSPLTLLFTERTAPELLYLETRSASLISYGMTTDLLTDILPSGGTVDASTIRRHLHKVAARHEADLGSRATSRQCGQSGRRPDAAHPAGGDHRRH